MSVLKKKIILGTLIITSLVLTAGYLYLFQTLVNQGSALADEHCMKVNPLIIARKNAYAAEINLIKKNAGVDEVLKVMDDYSKVNTKYIKAEQAWLAKENEFIQGLIFKIIMPGYIQEAAGYQYDMYKADFKSSLYLEKTFIAKDDTVKNQLKDKVIEQINKRNYSEKKYNDILDSEDGRFHWQFLIVKVPPTICPDKNFDIPEILNPFSPEVKIPGA